MIKVIAFLTMLTDHVGYIFFPDMLIFHLIGRIAFPLFAWGIAKGYERTSNFNAYAARLLLIACITQLPYYLLFRDKVIIYNICFTLFLGLIILRVIDTKYPNYVKALAVFLLTLVPLYLNLEGGIVSVLYILTFHYFKKLSFQLISQGILTFYTVKYQHYELNEFVSLLSPILIFYLQKYDFKLNRWINYGFYPIHITLLYLIRFLGESYFNS